MTTSATPSVQTLIMAGGRGERLYPLTASRPKPAVSFGECSDCRLHALKLSQFGPDWSLAAHAVQAPGASKLYSEKLEWALVWIYARASRVRSAPRRLPIPGYRRRRVPKYRRAESPGIRRGSDSFGRPGLPHGLPRAFVPSRVDQCGCDHWHRSAAADRCERFRCCRSGQRTQSRWVSGKAVDSHSFPFMLIPGTGQYGGLCISEADTSAGAEGKLQK